MGHLPPRFQRWGDLCLSADSNLRKKPHIHLESGLNTHQKSHVCSNPSSFLALRRSITFSRFKLEERASNTNEKSPKYTPKEPRILKHLFLFGVEAIYYFLEIQICGKSPTYEMKRVLNTHQKFYVFSNTFTFVALRWSMPFSRFKSVERAPHTP